MMTLCAESGIFCLKMRGIVDYVILVLCLAGPLIGISYLDLNAPLLESTSVVTVACMGIALPCQNNHRAMAIIMAAIPILWLKLCRTCLTHSVEYYVEVGPRNSSETNRQILTDFLACDLEYSQNVTNGLLRSVQEASAVQLVRAVKSVIGGIPNVVVWLLGGGVDVKAEIVHHNIKLPNKAINLYTATVSWWDFLHFDCDDIFKWIGKVFSTISVVVVFYRNWDDLILFEAKKLGTKKIITAVFVMSILLGISRAAVFTAVNVSEDLYLYDVLGNVSTNLGRLEPNKIEGKLVMYDTRGGIILKRFVDSGLESINPDIKYTYPIYTCKCDPVPPGCRKYWLEIGSCFVGVVILIVIQVWVSGRNMWLFKSYFGQ